MKRRLWTDTEREIIWPIYEKLSRSKFHSSTPEVAEIAAALGRTGAAVARKLCNLYWYDSDGAMGCPHGSHADRTFIAAKRKAGKCHPSLRR